MTPLPPTPASPSQAREQRLLEAALALDTESERGSFVASLDDPDLRRRLEELIASSTEAETFFCEAPHLHAGLDEPVIIPPARPPEKHPAEAPARMIGRYKLLEKIGEGGFGEVWMADQREPVKRRVALKIIKLGMDSRQVVARFEAERQALAMMDHPNIARIFDADVTDAGRPYFVMELVRGVRITDYCDQHQLPTRDRLDLFIKVCQAIQHAHQKGIIHRDIKPSNILVTLHDSVLVPKVIDFGIAKATAQELTDKTVFTQFQQFIGTPAYISPEQAELSGMDIDTRADIYSLGVLLYELLVGRTPFDAKEMLEGGLDALRQIIREKEPLRPSTKLNTLQGDDQTTAASRRQTDVGKLVHQLQGDLDWIVMKCLEKDRARRYETANGLAADIQRHLASEPVVARPPSKAYKIQKAWQRNKLVFTSVAVVALALFVGTGVSAWQAVRANVASRNAQEQQRRAESNERLAVSNAALASDRQGQAERSLQHLQYLLAEQHLSKSEIDRGLALLAVVLRNDPANVPAFRRLASALLHRPFHYPAALLTGNSRVCEFSPESHRILIAPGENFVQLWDLRTMQTVGDPMRHTDAVRCAAFSPDGKWIVTGSDDRTARLWDANTGSPVSSPLLQESSLTAVAFSPDGSEVATGSDDGRIKFWKSPNGEPARAMLRLASNIRSFQYSPDGRSLATASEDSKVRIWDLNTGQLKVPATTHEGGVVCVRFSPDGELVASASYKGSVILVSADTGSTVVKPMQSGFVVNSVEFNPDGTRLVSASMDGTASIWDAKTGRRIGKPLLHTARVSYARFSPDGELVVTVSSDETARLWNAKTSEPVSESMRHNGEVRWASFTADGEYVATAADDGKVRIWPVRSHGGPRTTLPQPNAWRVDFSPDGRRLVVADFDNIVRLWDVEKCQPVGAAMAHDKHITDVRFSPDGRRVLTASYDHTARIWDAFTGEPVGSPLSHEHWVFSAVFSPDGSRVATASQDSTARVWDARTGEPVGKPCRHQGWVMTVDFSPDGTRLVTSGEDNSAQIWNAATGDPIGKPFLHQEKVYVAQFSPDGGRIVTGSGDRTAQVWDALTGERIGKPLQNTAAVRAASFSPNGRWIITATEGGVSRVWDAATGLPVGPPLRREGWCEARFSPDGEQALTFSRASGTRLWDPVSGLPVSEPLEGGFWAAFSADGRRLATTNPRGVRIYDWPATTIPAPPSLPSLAELVGGLRLDPGQGNEEPVSPDEWEILWRSVAQSSGPGLEWLPKLLGKERQ